MAINDNSFPTETKFYYSKKKLVYDLLISVTCIIASLLFILKVSNISLSPFEYLFPAVFGLLSIWNIKKIRHIYPVIIINNRGIETESTFFLWSNISNEIAGYDEGSYIKFDLLENGRKLKTKTIPTEQLIINDYKEINSILQAYRSLYDNSLQKKETP